MVQLLHIIIQQILQNKKGLQFGNELSQIEKDISDIQGKFYSEKTKWVEEDISKDELIKFYKIHVNNFREIILKYDELTPPKLFQSSVCIIKKFQLKLN